MVSIHAIGLIVASLSPSEKATGAINSAIFSDVFLSGATVPYEILPTGLQKVADVMPLTQGIKLLKAVTFHEETGIFFTITLLVVITLIGLFVAIRYFRWGVKAVQTGGPSRKRMQTLIAASFFFAIPNPTLYHQCIVSC